MERIDGATDHRLGSQCAQFGFDALLMGFEIGRIRGIRYPRRRLRSLARIDLDSGGGFEAFRQSPDDDRGT